MSASRRRLQAILSGDAAGYSRLMGEDERHTLSQLNAAREIFRDRIESHAGRVVDTAGDSVLAVFDSVLEAIDCALQIQTRLAARNAGEAPARRMHFRIGINLGDIIEQEDGTIYGDGVNIAARIESLADPGGITLSGSVHEFIDGKSGLPVRFIGEHDVKNITRAVRVYALVMPEQAGGAAPTPAPPAVAVSARPSIAVLPFLNIGDPAEAYFADGISEDIITELSRFQELEVTARNSTFTYRDRAVKAQDVGRELNVRYILEGSVRKAGGRVRVTAQLIDAGSGNHIWAERFDRQVGDVFAVQDELTGTIVAILADKLADNERRRSRGDARTSNLQAYDLVLRGRELWFRMTREDNLAARALYEQALALDPHYTRAYASLSWTYTTAYNEYWADDPQAALDRALEYAHAGIELDPTSHSNWIALGQVHFFRKNLHKSIEAFEEALELNRNDADTYAFLAQALSVNAEPQKAIDVLDHAFALNPYLDQYPRSLYVTAYFNARRYGDAAAVMDRLESPRLATQRWAGANYVYLGRDEDARAAAAIYRTAYPRFDLTEHLTRIPFARDRDREHYANGLRLAGFG